MEWKERKTYFTLALAFVALACVSVFMGCAAQRKAETLEQRAGALLGDFNIFQSAALHVGSDASVPEDVRRKVVSAAVALKPAVDQLDELLRSYIAIKAELDAATDTETKTRTQARLEVAAANLAAWITDITPKIRALRTTLEGAFR